MTAHETYTRRRTDIDNLLAVLHEALAGLDAREKEDAQNWKFAGTLGHMRSKITGLAVDVLGVSPFAVAKFAGILEEER